MKILFLIINTSSSNKFIFMQSFVMTNIVIYISHLSILYSIHGLYQSSQNIS